MVGRLTKDKPIQNEEVSVKTKKVVFHVDHTLIDEKGESVRPGIVELLKSLKDNGVELAVWTASFKARLSIALNQCCNLHDR